jgi:hypothetical protein
VVSSHNELVVLAGFSRLPCCQQKSRLGRKRVIVVGRHQLKLVADEEY